MVVFSLQARPEHPEEFLRLARRAEEAGFDTLHCADHPGLIADPFVALAAAAAVTSTIRLGPYVANAGIREPMPLAVAVASLDLVSAGRARLGLGAGHTPAEWRAVGRDRPGIAARVRRFLAVTGAVRDLLDGAEVTLDTPELRVTGARLESPRPVQERIPVTVGTSNSRLLRWAGEHAEIVGLSGAGRTRPDGYQHDVRWRPAEVEAQLALVAEGAAGRADPPALEALVQEFLVTDDAEAAAAELAADTGITVADLLASPYVLIGTEEEILAAVRGHRRRFGITRYVVRADRFDQVAALLPRLATI